MLGTVLRYLLMSDLQLYRSGSLRRRSYLAGRNYVGPGIVAAASALIQSVINNKRLRNLDSDTSSESSKMVKKTKRSASKKAKFIPASVGKGSQKSTKPKKRSRSSRKEFKKISRIAKYVALHPRTPMQRYYNQVGVNLTWNVNQVGIGTYSHRNNTQCQTLLGNYRFIEDVAGQGTQSVTDLDGLTYPNLKQIFGRGKIQMTIRNAREHPSRVRVYWYLCIQTSNNSPATLWTKRADELAKGDSGWETEPVMEPGFMSSISKKYFKLLKMDSAFLVPGQTNDFYLNMKGAVYNPIDANLTSNTYQPKVTYVWIVRGEGVPDHDATTQTNVGLSSGQLDMVFKISDSYCFQGAPVQRMDDLDDALDTVTTEVGIAPQGDVAEESGA